LAYTLKDEESNPESARFIKGYQNLMYLFTKGLHNIQAKPGIPTVFDPEAEADAFFEAEKNRYEE